MTKKPVPEGWLPVTKALKLEDVAASLGEQIRRLENLLAVVRTMAKRQGMDWKALVEATERAAWAQAEREKLRRG